MPRSQFKLKNFNFNELFHAEGLKRLDEYFLKELFQHSSLLYSDLLAYRQESKTFTSLEVSELLIQCALFLENFLSNLFQIETALLASHAKTTSNNPVAIFRKFFILHGAKKWLHKPENLPSFAELDIWLENELKKAPLKTDDKELAIALLGNHYLQDPEYYSKPIQLLTEWCASAMLTLEGKQKISNWSSFKIPERRDYHQLVKYQRDKSGQLEGKENQLRLREGFKLTDPRMNAREVQNEVNYCIYCHDHEGDFCSKGFPAKKTDPSLGLKKNPLDVILTGCPLDEKISEMNFLKRDGRTLASLAMIMVDNPMCPATGHRICNDCMKACIYQKQDPVDIPQIETRVLMDVLNLPWGVEIYDLLTRWNPLRQKQWVMKPYNGLKVMIAGMGPAGFTLAHHLLLEGFAVVGFDGLKIEPLPEKWIKEPIYQFSDLKESLDERLVMGFGGVAEYGITARWDKNFLKLIYISLMRRPHFQVFGSVRFGGTIQVEDAWEMGFDHFVVAVGAGLPKALSIPGSLAPGMRQANDFLMALQLGNAAKPGSLTNLEVRLPAIIIGGGLTGVDTATEVQAYYIQQVEKILSRYEILSKKYGEDKILKNLKVTSIEILEEFLAHGKAVREERERAKSKKEPPNFIKLIRQWGGVTIAYRRALEESPAYINNHEELQKALQEGIYYLENVEPTAVDLDQFGYIETLICNKRLKKNNNEWDTLAEKIHIPARSLFVATGTQPNIAYEFEHRGTFNRLGFHYQHYEDTDHELIAAHGVIHCKEKNFGPFTSYHRHDKRVSLIGDTHPVFHGNVVKAIASGLRTYPKILMILKDKLGQIGDQLEYQQFAKKIHYLFSASVHDLKRFTPTVLELTVKAPLAAKHFQPGHFYRLQNYETFAPRINHTSLQIEPLALIASGIDRKKDLLKFIIIESGASSKLCATFKKDDPISLMGPTGIRAKIASEHETILIMGNQLSLAFMSSYGYALREKGNQVLYLGNFKHQEEVYNQEHIEKAADIIIWSTREGKLIEPNRHEDYSVHGEAVDILLRYAQGKLDPKSIKPPIPLSDVDRIFLIGDADLLRRFQAARKTIFKDFLVKNPRVSGSVYSLMQCMLKGVCAQCLQWQIDPETGKRTKAVFACSWQDQPLELIDFDNISERKIQNHLQEHLSNLWVDFLFEEYNLARI